MRKQINLAPPPWLYQVVRLWPVFWEWWRDELRGLLARLQPGKRSSCIRAVVKPDCEILFDSLGDNPTDAQHITIVLPGNMLMYKVANLPMMSDKNIGKAIRYEFDKYFPLSIDKVQFSYKVSTGPDKQYCMVEMWALSHQLFERLVSDIQSKLGMTKIGYTIEDALGHSVFSGMTSQRIQHASTRLGLRGRPMLWAQGFMLVAVLVYPIFGLNHYIESLEQEIKVLNGNAKDVLVTRTAMQSIEERLKAIVSAKQDNLSSVEILSDISAYVKADGSINRVKYDGRLIEVSGTVASVEKMVKKIQTSEKYTGVQIVAPVRKLEANGQEDLNLTYVVKHGK